ncbi:peptidase MA family metallohydrolase [Corallococcus sp. RDP092CA]|uniref:peptidase MA family metallohydrolase n=1 Tax=Corallococcus sp. RDP092CA TaxID=3109369 RepID=UPI0035AFFB7F
MNTPLIAVLLLAAAPPAQKAKELAAHKEWEELYLAFAAADPAAYPEPQRPQVAGPLLKGCEALLADDAVMAYSLGERAVAFQETAGGLRCLARSALKTDQRAAAEEALKKGLEQFPKDGAFALELGRLQLLDKDSVGALATLQRVPPKSKEAAEARKLMQQARAQVSEEGAARREAERLELRMNGEPAPGNTRQAKGSAGGDVVSAGLSYESSEGKDGMRVRQNRRFAIRYFNSNRDFGQRAEYEGKVVSALDEAYDFTQRTLGRARERQLNVVLYTRDEFATHLGETYAARVAGLYHDNAIRMNDAAELTQNTKATLVHEYVHAALDEICPRGGDALPRWFNEGLAEYIEWRYLGLDGPPRGLRDRMRGHAKQGSLPSLSDMDSRALISMADPEIAYGTSAMAVRELVRLGGQERLLDFVQKVGQSGSFQEVLKATYEKDFASLDQAVRTALSGR